jgi:hypothetical protein
LREKQDNKGRWGIIIYCTSPSFSITISIVCNIDHPQHLHTLLLILAVHIYINYQLSIISINTTMSRMNAIMSSFGSGGGGGGAAAGGGGGAHQGGGQMGGGGGGGGAGGGYVDNKSITPKGDQIDFSKIFVGGLSWSSTEETLSQYFQQFGNVVKVEIMRDRVTGNPRGFCFIIFDSDEAVEKIVNHGKHIVDEKGVDVKRAQARGQAPPSIHRGPGGPPGAQGGGAGASGGGGNNTFGGGGAGGGSPTRAPHQNQQQQQHSHQAPPPQIGLSAYGSAATAASSSPSKGGAAGDNGDGLSPEQLMNKLFVGGLHLAVDKEEMQTYFGQYGPGKLRLRKCRLY